MDGIARTAVVAVAAAVIAGGGTAWVMETTGRSHPPQGGGAALPPEGAPARVPIGDLAGAAQASLPDNLPNPFEGNAGAAEEGHRLYDRMNCAGCHGYKAKGGMGPDLTDNHWRYGGTPVQIYKSIYEGRPKGMPAWGRALPSNSIWQLTSYIESLGGSFPPAQYHAGMQGDLGDQGAGTQGAGKGKNDK